MFILGRLFPEIRAYSKTVIPGLYPEIYVYSRTVIPGDACVF